MRHRFDAFTGIAAKLLADHFQLFVKPRGPDSDIGIVVLHQFDQPQAGLLRIAALAQNADLFGDKALCCCIRYADVVQADYFALADGDTTLDLA